MSKVIHLSNEAHAQAKSYCKEHGFKMSDWVATLIQGAIVGAPNLQKPGLMPVGKRKSVSNLEEQKVASESVEAVYAAPPFWARDSKS